MKILKSIFILLVAALAVSPALAACPDATNSAGYVRAAASGSGSGADWTNAYTSLPASLSRGCTYYVAVGTYPAHTFSDADSGTTTITIQAPTIASHGTATGWSNSYVGQAVWQCSSTCGGIWTFTTDYYVINGVYRQKSSPESPYVDWKASSAYGFAINNGNHFVNNDNPIISGGTGFNGPACGSQAACNLAGVFIHDIAFHYLWITGSATTTDANNDYGYMFQGGSYDITVDHSGESGIGEPNYFRGNHACTTGCSAGGTYFFGSGANNTLEFSFYSRDYTSTNNHGEFCSCSEGQVTLTIADNWIENMVGTSVYASPSPGVFSNGPIYIYGNVWTQDNGSNCAVGQGFAGMLGENYNAVFVVVNNTIAFEGTTNCSGQDEDGWGYNSGEAQTWSSMVTWENNLWYVADLGSSGISLVNSCGAGSCGTINQNTFTGGVTWDYNAYYKSPDSAAGDTSSHKSSLTTNPFVSASYGSSYNFSLVADTTAGISTHSLVAGNDTDMLGNTRTTWSRGALQFVTSSTPSVVTGVTAVGVTLN